MVESRRIGGRIKGNWKIVQNNTKWSKVVYSDENATWYLVGVRFVNEKQLIELPILRNPFEIRRNVCCVSPDLISLKCRVCLLGTGHHSRGLYLASRWKLMLNR